MMGRMSFDEVWIGRMHACIGISSISVLVNSSPITKFQTHKSLRKEDTLSPFFDSYCGRRIDRLGIEGYSDR